MNFRGYGEKFRLIREQKGLPLSFFAKCNVDKADLSRFERGQSMMSFEKVDVMLQSMNVSLAEYELVINNFVPDFQEEFLFEIDEADFSQDEKKLRSLYQEAKESGYGYLSLAAKARFEQLSQTETMVVVQFLKKVKVWGYFELSVAFFVLDNLDTETIRDLMVDFEQKNKNYYGIFRYRRRILQIAYRAIVLLCSRGEQDLAKDILALTEKRNRAGIDLYLDNVRQMALGFYDYYFGDKKSGLSLIQKGLNVFEFLGQERLKNFYRIRNEHFLK